MKKNIYVVVILTKTDDEINVSVVGASYDQSKAEERMKYHEHFKAPSQLVDIFEAEEF